MAANRLRILAKNDDERLTVILPVPKHSVWPTENIAYFCSTGKSRVEAFSGTYFPMFGVYVNEDTPIPDIDRSITLVENYFVKTSSIAFVKPTSDKMQEWIFVVLRDYYKSRGMSKEFQYELNDLRDIMDVKRLKQLLDMYQEIDLIFRCLSSYFTAIWQVHFSVCLSDTFQTGVWLSELKKFADFIKSISLAHPTKSPKTRSASHSPGKNARSPKRTPKKMRKSRSVDRFTITDDQPLTSDNVYDFLIRNNAQCDFTRLRETIVIEWYKTRSSHMHDSLYKNLQSVEMYLKGAERAASIKGGTLKIRKCIRFKGIP
jgi:hypothetical protein